MTSHQRRPGFRLRAIRPRSRAEVAAARRGAARPRRRCRASPPTPRPMRAPAAERPRAVRRPPAAEAAPAAADQPRPLPAAVPRRPVLRTAAGRRLVSRVHASISWTPMRGVAETSPDAEPRRPAHQPSNAPRGRCRATRARTICERADADVAGIGEWSSSEAERIKHEAEQTRRCAPRRSSTSSSLPRRLAPRAETKALRDRVVRLRARARGLPRAARRDHRSRGLRCRRQADATRRRARRQPARGPPMHPTPQRPTPTRSRRPRAWRLDAS